MCNECIRESIINNAKKVLNLDLTHFSYERISGLSKLAVKEMTIRKINVNDNRDECIELFRSIFDVHD